MKHLLQKTIALKALLLVSMLIGAGSGAWAEDYVKVTSEADLVHGDYYILVAESANKALSSFNTSGTKYGIGTDVTIENETISTTNVMSFFLDGSKSGGWSLKSESLNQYLSWSSGNSLTTGSTAYKWTITFSGGNVLIVSQNDSSRKIRWNSVSPRFACYTSEQTDIQLYKLVEANVSPLASIAVDASVATTVFHVGDAFTHEGVVVTATYENESTKDVTTSATFSTPDMTTAGTKTVTISYTENEVEKTTSYTIEVKAAAALESITLSGTYPTEFTQGGVFSSEGIVVTANYDDETTKDVTEEASFSGYDMTATGTQTVTVGFGGKTATYTITVNAYTQPTEVTVNMNYEWLESGNGSNLSSSQLPVVKEQDNITITITDGTTTRPRGDADYIRVYNGSTIKFEAPTGYNVTKIVFTTGGSGTWNAPTVDEGTLSEKTWTGEATEVTFSLNGSCFIASAKVSLDTAAPKVLSSIALSGEYPTTFHIGDAFSHEGMTVTATYESGKTADVTASATFSGYDMATAGTQTVTVSYAEGEVTKIATYDITINAPAALSSITLSGTYTTEFGQGDEFSSEGIVVTANYDDDTTSDVTGRATFSGYDMATLGEQTVTVTYEGKTATYIITVVEKKGTATNPYTVAEARAAIDAGTGLTGVYATGIISQVDSYNSDYNSITYWISSDGTTTSDQLQVYSGKGLNNTNFSSVNDVAVGATVVIYGTLKKYNSTYEFDKNNYLTSYTEPVVAVETPTFSPEPGVYTKAQTVTITCDTEGATIMYCFDGQEWQEYPENGILLSEYKTYIIHAKAEKGSDVSRYAEATYTINDPNAPGSANQPYTVAEAVAAVDAGTGITGVYVTGIISQVDSYQNSKYITYWISADGTTESQQFEVYKGLGIDGAAFSSKDDLQVGDEVVVKGNITLYNSSTYEFVVDNQLVSLKRKQTVTLSFEKPEYTATLDETFTAPTLTIKDAKGEDVTGLTITYSFESFGNLPIEINAKTGVVTLKTEGEATVIATFAGDDEYKPATASYKLTVMSNKTASNLAIDVPNSTTLNVGDKIQLGYTSEGDGTITWKSSNEAVMTVDQQGNVTAVAVGKATITATQSETESCLADEASIELTVEDPNQGECLWLLSEASYSSASADQVTWTSDYATMDVTRAEGGTAANNYLGGTNNYTSSRFYLNSTLTITPAEGYRIASVLFQATTEKYATAFQSSTWTNAEATTTGGTNVIVTPTDGMAAIVATIGGTCGFDKVLVTYVKTGEVVITPSITLEQYEYNVNADGGDAELIVTCSNMPEDPKLKVKFVEADGETATTYGWITAVINEEGNIAGHMDANTGEARTAYFIVTGKDGDGNVVKSQLITINQAAPAAPSITIEGSIDFAASGESDRKLSFEYESLGDNPTFEICFFDREGNAATYDWVTTATIEDNKVNLSVAANDGEARAAYFKVHAEGTEVYSNLVTISQAAFVADYAKLPFSWDGGASADLKALNGVTTNGLGSDYAESNKPYLVKFDSDNDYIQVKTDSRPGIVTVEVKMLGGANSSKITVQESTDGETFTDVQELAISGKSNDILALETTNAFAEDSRYVRLTFTKGSNVGVGPISIAQYVAPSTEPSIAVKVNNITAKAEGVEGIIDVTYKNITNVAADVQFVDAKGEAATYDWIDAGINEENNVVYVIGENTDTEARTAYMQVYALDDEAQDVYSEIITITQEGYVAPLPAVTYSLATTITSGKHYLITDGTSKVMGAQNSNNRAAVSVTFSEGKFSVTEEDKVAEVVICGPDANGFYTIYESGYLYAASSGSNNLKSAATADANGLWQIDIDAATGEASVIASGSLNRNVMQYNATSSIFSCYASASQKPVYFYERDDEETPVASYTRDVASVKWGTICLPNTATITGAQLYSIAGKDKDEAPSALYLTEVKGTAAAGTPYIFKPTASVINAYYTGEAATEAKAVNGLIGSFTGTPVDPGMYLLSKGEIVLCGEGCSIAENRAYIDMSKVKRLSDGEVTGSEVKLNIGGGEDGISSLDAASEGAVIYDLSGRRVSKTVKGLYIVNGKKVSVK